MAAGFVFGIAVGIMVVGGENAIQRQAGFSPNTEY
jgi:hypothetical protein